MDLLRRRKFHQLACDNQFQPYYDQITKEEGLKMVLAAYGDIGFRVPSIAHARYYHEVGTKTFVFNFDTHERDHWLVGAGHADELKYFHRWGLAKGIQ